MCWRLGKFVLGCFYRKVHDYRNASGVSLKTIRISTHGLCRGERGGGEGRNTRDSFNDVNNSFESASMTGSLS